MLQIKNGSVLTGFNQSQLLGQSRWFRALLGLAVDVPTEIYLCIDIKTEELDKQQFTYNLAITGQYWYMYVKKRIGFRAIHASSSLLAIAMAESSAHLDVCIRLSNGCIFTSAFCENKKWIYVVIVIRGYHCIL